MPVGLHGLGLRSLGPVWSRKTIFGDGVPFAFGRDGDIGAGLTDDALKDRVRRVIPLNMGALLLSVLGLILIVMGVALG